MARILVVDDEEIMVNGIRFNLELEGYQVDTSENGRDAVEMARNTEYDVILLDLMMPEVDGLDACRQIRTFSMVPIIILTARSATMDKLLGFDFGADDYVTKPFDILELKARIKALLRRSASARFQGRVLSSGDLRLEEATRSVWRNGTKVALTVKEFDLLALLMQNPGKAMDRESLLRLVWGAEFTGDHRTVDVHIRHLREKIETDPAAPARILTKWGMGYFYQP